MSGRMMSAASAFQPSSHAAQKRLAEATSPARRLGNQAMAAKVRHERLAKLAEDPANAHRAWRRLSQAERNELIEVMREMYGSDFVSQFLEAAENGDVQIELQHWGPDTGPSPRRLRELGYRRKGKILSGNMGVDLEWWVHPSGKSVHRDVSPRPPVAEQTAPESGESPPVDDQGEAVQMLRQMTVANNQLAKYCEMRPIETGKAAGAAIDFDSALGRLQNKLKDVDMSRHPRFWQKVEAQITRNNVVRVPCCEEQPENYWFSCRSIMGPTDDEE